jgi:hypothetical protein
MKKKKEIIIHDDVFGTDVLFLIGCEKEEYLKRIKRYGIEDEIDDYTYGTVIEAGKNFFRIVWIRERNIGEIVHEVFHLVVRICKDKGVPIIESLNENWNGDETAAYLMGFYVNKLKDNKLI